MDHLVIKPTSEAPAMDLSPISTRIGIVATSLIFTAVMVISFAAPI